MVDRTGPLSAAQARELATQLAPTEHDHPWPDEIGSGVFSQRQRVAITKVQPMLVLEVADDPRWTPRRTGATERGRAAGHQIDGPSVTMTNSVPGPITTPSR
jgi:hypothetical protein